MDCLIENERLMYSLGCIRRRTVYVHVPMYIYKICAQKYAPFVIVYQFVPMYVRQCA